MMLPEPKSPYAITKLDGEYYCNMFAEEGRLQTICLRFFNVFGPRQDPASPYAAAVPIFIERMLPDKPVTIYGDGGQTRDFIYVKEVVAINWHFARFPNSTGVFNVTHGWRITILELAESIRRLTNSCSEIQFASERAGDVRHSVADVEKARIAGFSPQARLHEALQETVNFFCTKSRGVAQQLS